MSLLYWKTESRCGIWLQSSCHETKSSNQFSGWWFDAELHVYIAVLSADTNTHTHASTTQISRIFSCDRIFKAQMLMHTARAHCRFAPSQWETALLCNDVSHWLGASLESALTASRLDAIKESEMCNHIRSDVLPQAMWSPRVAGHSLTSSGFQPVCVNTTCGSTRRTVYGGGNTFKR